MLGGKKELRARHHAAPSIFQSSGTAKCTTCPSAWTPELVRPEAWTNQMIAFEYFPDSGLDLFLHRAPVAGILPAGVVAAVVGQPKPDPPLGRAGGWRGQVRGWAGHKTANMRPI